MSQEHLKAFIKKTASDKELQDKLAGLPKEDRGRTVTLLADIAAESGFEIDAADFEATEADSLNDDILDAVVGGAGSAAAAVAECPACSAGNCRVHGGSFSLFGWLFGK